MKTNKMSEQAINALIKEGLISLGYPPNLTIESFILPPNQISYQIYYEATIDNQKQKYLKTLTQKDFLKVLKYILEIKGFTITKIKPIINNQKITYELTTQIKDNGYIYKPRRNK